MKLLGRSKRVLVLAGAMVLASASGASAWDNDAGEPKDGSGRYTTAGVVKIVSVNRDGGFWVELEGSPKLCNSASSSSSVTKARVKAGEAGADEAGVDNAMSIALAAQLSGKKVSIRADNSGNWGCALFTIDIRP